MPSIDFLKDIQENDRKTFFKDFENSKKLCEKVLKMKFQANHLIQDL